MHCVRHYVIVIHCVSKKYPNYRCRIRELMSKKTAYLLFVKILSKLFNMQIKSIWIIDKNVLIDNIRTCEWRWSSTSSWRLTAIDSIRSDASGSNYFISSSLSSSSVINGVIIVVGGCGWWSRWAESLRWAGKHDCRRQTRPIISGHWKKSDGQK